MTQGDPLSPKIFNVVVYAFLQNWVTVVELAEEAVEPGVADTEVYRKDVQRLSEYFYADNGILTSTQVARL